MKKLLILTLVLVFALTIAACGAAKPTQLGTSAFSIVLPDGFKSVADDFDEDQVAYYYKDDNTLDLDVYQWAKSPEYTLEGEAAAFAELYGTTAEAVTVNGFAGMKYVSLEEYEGQAYTVVNYMFEDDTSLVEICFWTDDSAEEHALVDSIIGTLAK